MGGGHVSLYLMAKDLGGNSQPNRALLLGLANRFV
jgi:hypothetical protein